jgi:hypothetical protein
MVGSPFKSAVIYVGPFAFVAVLEFPLKSARDVTFPPVTTVLDAEASYHIAIFVVVIAAIVDMLALALLGKDVPPAFVAVTLKVYAVEAVNPETVIEPEPDSYIEFDIPV